jgi:hypothetical protein
MIAGEKNKTWCYLSLILIFSTALFSCSLSTQAVEPAGTLKYPLQFTVGKNECCFMFQTNGNYSVYWEYYSMATKERRQIDAGTWHVLETNRLKMVSHKLLFASRLKYNSFIVHITTRESLTDWLSVDKLLKRSTNAVFHCDDYKKVLSEDLAGSSGSMPFEEERMGGEIKILNKMIPRSDFETFHRDLVRLQQVPEYWEVVCDVVKQDGRMTLIPEKSKQDDFCNFYFSLLLGRESSLTATNCVPRLRADIPFDGLK